MHDMLGINLGKNPKFVHNFMEGQASVQAAMSAYVAAVKDGTFTGGCDPRRDGYCVPV